MKVFSELAIESAESAGRGVCIDKGKVSPRLRCLEITVEKEEGTQERYCTLLTEGDLLAEDDLAEEMSQEVTRILFSFLSKNVRRVLAVGLGNPSTVVDSLGCETVKRLSAGERKRGRLASFIPSVYGMTGLETASMVRGVAKEFCPDLVLTVDTLSTRRAERLVRAVQIGVGGIVPGGGVGNPRDKLSQKTVGAPVLSVGVPLLARADACASLPAGLVVTPKEIDLLVPLFARILSDGVERALRKKLG